MRAHSDPDDSLNRTNMMLAGAAFCMMRQPDIALPFLQRVSKITDAWRNAFLPGGAVVRLEAPKTEEEKERLAYSMIEQKMFKGMGYMIQWLRDQNRYPEAVEWSRLCLKLCRQHNCFYHIISALATFGKSLMFLPPDQQRPTETLHALSDALWWADATQWSELPDRELLFVTLGDVSRMCMVLQLHDMAISLLQRGLSIGQTLNQKGEESLWLLHRRLGECYVQQDRFDDAMTAFKYAINSHQAVFQVEVQSHMRQKVKQVVRSSLRNRAINYWTLCRQTETGRPTSKHLQLLSAVEHLSARLAAHWSPADIRKFFRIEVSKDVVTVQRELKQRGDLKLQNCWFFECGASQQGAKFKRCGKCLVGRLVRSLVSHC